MGKNYLVEGNSFGLLRRVKKGEGLYYKQETNRVGGDNRVVIGRTTNGPFSRQYKVACVLRLVAWEPAGGEVPLKKFEDSRHDRFRDLLVPGTREWFYGRSPLMEWIDSLVAEFGLPFKGEFSKGERKSKLESIVSDYSADLLEAVANGIILWWNVGLKPRKEDVFRCEREFSRRMYADVGRQWTSVTMKRDDEFMEMFPHTMVCDAWMRVCKLGGGSDDVPGYVASAECLLEMLREMRNGD